MSRGNEHDRRLFCVESRIAEVHNELWELFEFVMRLQRQMEGMEVKVASKRGRGSGRRSRKSYKGR